MARVLVMLLLQVVNTAVVGTNMPFNQGTAEKKSESYTSAYTELHFEFSFQLTQSGSFFSIVSVYTAQFSL